jgi:quinol monooxygenase YgiN
MPISVRIVPHQMSRADYEQVIHELEESGSGDPDGRLSHPIHGDDAVHVEETWETREQFERHHQERLAVLQASGLDAGIVDISELRGGV